MNTSTKVDPSRLLYFGDPQGANALLDLGIVPIGIVHGRRGGPGWLQLLSRCKETLRFLMPDLSDPLVCNTLLKLGPTLVVSCFYPKRIPKTLLSEVPGVNIHPSNLPRWRGPDPCTWTILKGDETTALCVHWLTEEIDEGDVICRIPVTVRPRESAGALANRLERQGAEFMAQVVNRLVHGEKFEAVPQHGDITWAPTLEPDEWEIQWSQPAWHVDRVVRAASPYPGAFTGLGNELLVIYSGRAVDAGAFDVLSPGTPYVDRGYAHVRCGDGAYRLNRIALGRRRMTGKRLARLLI